MKKKNPEQVDPSFWTNFVLNALRGGNPDNYFKEHEYHIMAVANYLRKKFGFPVDNNICWRGLMVPKNLSNKKDLSAWEHTSFVSFSENKEIALLFGDMKHNISRFFAIKHPDYIGILCKELLKAEEVIFHWEWFFKTPLHQMMPDWVGIVREQKEIMVKNMKRPLQIEMKIQPGQTQGLWCKYPYTSSTN